MNNFEFIENQEFEKDLDTLIDNYIHYGDDVFGDILCSSPEITYSCDSNDQNHHNLTISNELFISTSQFNIPVSI